MRPRPRPLAPPAAAALDICSKALRTFSPGVAPRARASPLNARVRRRRFDRGAPRGRRVGDLALRKLAAAQLRHRAPVAHVDDSTASLDQLLKFRRDHQDAQARRGELVDERLDFALRADVYPARRLVEDEELRVLAEPAREQDLLLVASRKLAYFLLRARSLDAEPPHVALDHLVLLRTRDDAHLAHLGQRRERQVLAHREFGDDAFGLPVFREEGQPRVNRVAGRAHVERAAFEIDSAFVHRVRAEYRAGVPRPPRPGGPARADDLAAARLDRHVVELAPPRQVLGAKQRRGLLLLRVMLAEGGRAPALQLLALLAEHQADEVNLFKPRERARGDELAVAQNGHAVADGVQLVEAVADVDDANALRLQTPDHVVEDGDLVLGERAGRLVQDDDPRAERDAARDCDHLPEREVQAPQRRARVNVESEPLQDRPGVGVHSVPVYKAEAARLAPQEDVFGDGAVREEIDLLVDGDDAMALRVLRRAEVDLAPIEHDAPAVAAISARQDLDER